jgi:hypothetical protein
MDGPFGGSESFATLDVVIKLGRSISRDVHIR